MQKIVTNKVLCFYREVRNDFFIHSRTLYFMLEWVCFMQKTFASNP